MMHLSSKNKILAKDFNLGCQETHRNSDGRRVSIWKEHGVYQISESPSHLWECTSGAPTLREARTEARRRLSK